MNAGPSESVGISLRRSPKDLGSNPSECHIAKMLNALVKSKSSVELPVLFYAFLLGLTKDRHNVCHASVGFVATLAFGEFDETDEQVPGKYLASDGESR